MKKALVGTRYGKIAYEYSLIYPNAKRRKPMGCVLPIWPIRRLAIIYHCSSCNKAKKLYGKKKDKVF